MFFNHMIDWRGDCYRLEVRHNDARSRYADVIHIKDFRDNFELPERYKYLKNSAPHHTRYWNALALTAL